MALDQSIEDRTEWTKSVLNKVFNEVRFGVLFSIFVFGLPFVLTAWRQGDTVNRILLVFVVIVAICISLGPIVVAMRTLRSNLIPEIRRWHEAHSHDLWVLDHEKKRRDKIFGAYLVALSGEPRPALSGFHEEVLKEMWRSGLRGLSAEVEKYAKEVRINQQLAADEEDSDLAGSIERFQEAKKRFWQARDFLVALPHASFHGHGHETIERIKKWSDALSL